MKRGLAAFGFLALVSATEMAAQTTFPPGAPTSRVSTQQSVTVTADRGLTGLDDGTGSVVVLGSRALQSVPAITLDDRLRQVEGFFLFRRTSSLTANPTTEGVSLRGLGSTAASRTLVVSDQVPLNDPFGGWVHWSEIPSLAIDGVALLRGGAANLYGSSAIGGVIDVVPVTPETPVRESGTVKVPRLRFATAANGAAQSTAATDSLLTSATRAGGSLAALSTVATNGYIPTAPSQRGAVDSFANVTGESARLELRTPTAQGGDTLRSAFVRGNLLNESRQNGTVLQTNGTRLWRYAMGEDFRAAATDLTLRLFGSREAYRQSFSSIAADRNSERLTRLQRVPADEFGYTLLASRSLGDHFVAALGTDLRDVRATDDETLVTTMPNVTTSIRARQREVGGFADGLWQPGKWTVGASVRVDSYRTFDAQTHTSAAPAAVSLPEVDELFASPHIGVERQLPHGFALRANAFRAFRGPTLNELYRTGQVGSQTTLANNRLMAERATGFDAGAVLHLQRIGSVEASYFWTEVNRPVSAVLQSQTATAQTLQRQNLGQIRSRGLSVDARLAPAPRLQFTLGYQLAIATVTAFNTSSPLQANLTGNWIPQVPREAFTSTGIYDLPHVAQFTAVATYTGRQYDDAANQYVLHPYSRFDLAAERALTHQLSARVSVANLLDRAIEAGRTPVLTLASPLFVEGGLRFHFAR